MMRRGTVWLIGLLGIVALWGAAVAMKARPIERQIAATTVSELQRRGLDRRFESLAIHIDGRDLTLTGTALSEADRAGALAAAAATPGVNRVVDRMEVAPEVKPFVFRAVRNADGSLTLAGVVPSPVQLDRVAGVARALFGNDLHVSARLARGAPEGDWFGAAKLAVEVAALIEHGEAMLSDLRLTVTGRAPDDAALDAVAAALARGMPSRYEGHAELYTALDEELRGGPLASIKDCEAMVDKVMKGHTLRFAPGTSTLLAVPPRLLDRLALGVRRCESLYLQIIAASDTHAGDPGANLRLGESRAEALADELAKRGVLRGRITALGRAQADPRERARSPDVEFKFSGSAVPVVRPYIWQFEKRPDGSGAIAGHHPSSEAQAALASLARPALRGPLADNSRLAHGAPPGEWQVAAQLAIEILGRLEHGLAVLVDDELTLRGVAKDDETARAAEALLRERMPANFRAKSEITTALDEELKGGPIGVQERCQVLFDTVARTGEIEFIFDGPALLDRQRQLFQRLAAAARRCQEFIVEIGAHGSGAGDPEASRALSERWALAVADAVARAGAERRWLRAIGFGNTRPVGESATEAGRLRNRRIVFRIVP